MFAEIRKLEQLSYCFRLVTDGIFNIWIGIFLRFFGTITLYVRFIVVCSHSTIVLYLLFILSCTTLEVRICVHSICIILLLRHKYSASLQNQHNWCHIPLRIAHRPSRANGGAPIPAPMVALPFRRLLTFVRPTPVPPAPHPVHPSHPSHPSHVGSNQPAHCNPSRANGGGPVPALPFRRALTTARPTPVPPTPHPVHPSYPTHLSHPSSNQPMHKSRCVLIQTI